MTEGGSRSYGLDELLEASWAARGRRVAGRELRIELLISSTFVFAGVLLPLLAGTPRGVGPAVVLVVVAYAVAASVEFPIGAAYFVPTQLLLVPLFALTSASLVPLLVFAAFVLAAVIAALRGRRGYERIVFCGNDAFHALGPALVICVLADADARTAGVAVLLLAFAAQLATDLISSSVHELATMGARPAVHAALLARVWGVDAALSIVAVPVAITAVEHPWAGLSPLPLVLLLGWIAGERTRAVSAAHDRLVALGEEQVRRRAAAELLDRHTRFLQDVSHELKTPVTIARGHLEAADPGGGASEEIDVALDELSRLERIIERLLVLAVTEEPEPPQRRVIDAESFLEDRFVRWSDSTPRAWRLGSLAEGSVLADEDALAAALDALLENAVKHTTRTQAISVSSVSDGDTLSITIGDTGEGIPEEAFARIFDRFSRADSARNREVGGVGLGLALVQAVAKAHGGECSVDSSPAGSAFTLRLGGFAPEGARQR